MYMYTCIYIIICMEVHVVHVYNILGEYIIPTLYTYIQLTSMGVFVSSACVASGVLSDILDYVLEPANVIQREATPGEDTEDAASRPTVRAAVVADSLTLPLPPQAINEMVYVECFNFLRAFARRNLEVQNRLYERMDDLLEIEVGVHV